MKRGLSLFLVLLLLVAFLPSCVMDRQRVKCIEIKLTNEEYAFGVGKENKELLSVVNAVINRIKLDGTLDQIIEKYLNEREDEYIRIPSGVENPVKKQLIVATHTPFSPFELSHYESGKGKMYSGIDIEIADLIAKELNLELVIKDISFDEVLTAVSEGEADIALAGISKSPARQELVDFSTTYYKASQILIVKDDDTTFDSCKTKKDVEAIISAMGQDTVAGAQKDTTSAMYITGDTKMGFDGFDISYQGYATAIHATHALLNGQLAFVVVDESVAKLIVRDINGE